MAQYYKVTNLGPEVLHKTWTTSLLPDEDLAAYEEFKKSPDFVGRDDADRVIKKEVAEAVKTRIFFDRLAKGVRIRIDDKTREGSVPRYEYQFVIGPNPKELRRLRLDQIRSMADKYEIAFTMDDDVNAIATKLTSKFGPHIHILSEKQWITSGLRDTLEFKEKPRKLQPGQLKPEYIREGWLEAHPMSDVEAESWERGEQPTELVKEEKSAGTRDVRDDIMDQVEAMGQKDLRETAKDLKIEYKITDSNDTLKEKIRKHYYED